MRISFHASPTTMLIVKEGPHAHAKLHDDVEEHETHTATSIRVALVMFKLIANHATHTSTIMATGCVIES